MFYSHIAESLIKNEFQENKGDYNKIKKIKLIALSDCFKDTNQEICETIRSIL